MSKNRISISDSKGGDIVAADVVNDRGVLILVQNTVINPYIQEKLAIHGIDSIDILSGDFYKDLQSDNNLTYEVLLRDYKESIASMRDIIKDLAAGEGLNVKRVKNIVQLISNKKEHSSNIVRCMQMLKSKDEYTFTHCINTAFYAMMIGKWLKFSKHEIEEVVLAGILHDIGKVRIPEAILNKKGMLTSDEFEIMKHHSIYGYEILQDYEEFDQEVRRAVLFHHERVDRTGYPFNASPDEVGIYAKIIAVADVFDAMTSDRVYKKKATPFEAFEMFRTIGIGIFDTKVINAFTKNLTAFYIGMDVELSNGKIGKIVYIPPQDISSPIVCLDSEYFDLSQNSNLRIVGIA